MTRAAVLGGGGTVGIAWELGVLAGLADAGVEPRWDRIVGTSAGSVVGALVASGRSLPDLYADHLGLALDDVRAPAEAADMAPLFAFMARKPPAEPAPQALLADLGAFAARASTVDEAAFVAALARLLPTPASWPDGFTCTAVDVETGAFRAWTRTDVVDLPRAVASSCAVPGLYPPVTLGGARYMDGGMRSATNGDLAGGAAAVLMLAVTLPLFAEPMAAGARRELADLEAAGTRTALVVPDADAHAAFGPSLMETARRVAVLKAGFSQGRREADRVGPVVA